eukprot:jgi/Bigna1/82503/fgenesh1_pg.93_\
MESCGCVLIHSHGEPRTVGAKWQATCCKERLRILPACHIDDTAWWHKSLLSDFYSCMGHFCDVGKQNPVPKTGHQWQPDWPAQPALVVCDWQFDGAGPGLGPGLGPGDGDGFPVFTNMLWRSLGPAAFVIAALTFLDLAGAHRSQINLEEASPSSYDPYFPEMDIPEIAAKPPKALCISGGGVRAHAAGVGVLRALTDMGLMDKFRYLGAASGGGWLITAYSYFRPNYTFESNDGLWKAPFTTAANDQELLGEIVYPENITWAHLDHVSPQSLRSCGPPFENAFISAIHRVFLEKAAIRGSSMAHIELIVSRPGRPFMAVGTILLGPMDRVTFDRFKRNYILLETNPLFVGRQNVGNITYISSSKLPWKSTPQTFTVGGALETFAFGASAPDSLSELYLRANDTTGHLRDVKLPEHPFTLSHAAASTGYDFADEISSQLGPISPLLSALLGFKYPYFSPSAQASAPLPSMNDFIADATSKTLQEGIGMVENKRQQQLLRTVILQKNAPFLLIPIKHPCGGVCWDLFRKRAEAFQKTRGGVLTTTGYTPKGSYFWGPSMAEIVTAYFGIDIDKAGSTYDYSRNHVFETSQFNEFVVALQNATRGGKGMVVQMELNVVDNSHWGVQGGRKVNVTWLYLGRAFEWESQLPEDVRAEASVPSKNPQVFFRSKIIAQLSTPVVNIDDFEILRPALERRPYTHEHSIRLHPDDSKGNHRRRPHTLKRAMTFGYFPCSHFEQEQAPRCAPCFQCVSFVPQSRPSTHLAGFDSHKNAFCIRRYSPAQANLLSDLAGWIVKENREKFCRTLGC